jgi:hypothetical protein
MSSFLINEIDFDNLASCIVSASAFDTQICANIVACPPAAPARRGDERGPITSARSEISRRANLAVLRWQALADTPKVFSEK